MLSVSEVAVQRAQLWRAGFRPVPIRNAILGDKASGKAPLGEAWPTAARSDPPAAVVHPPTASALNTGILCDGLRAIDLDIDNPSIAAAATALAEEMLGEPLTRSRRGSARVLLLYRAASGEPRKLTLAGRLGKVEALGAGQQFVAFGTHWEHLAELEWSPHPPGVEVCEDLVAVSEPQVEGFLAAVAPLIDAKQRTVSNGADHAPADAQADALRIATALNDIPNAGAPDWEAWNNAGMAVWRATGGSDAGWEMFRAWSARHPAFDLAVTRERWEHYFRSPPDRIGAGSLFHLASEARAEARADAYQAPPPELQSPPLEDGGEGALPFVAFANITAALIADDFVEGLLCSSSLAVVYGEPGSGKTFWVLDICLHVAAGYTWQGRAVEQGAVVYLALEGGSGIRNRIAAARTSLDLPDATPFALVQTPIDLCRADADVGRIVETVAQVAAAFQRPVALIVVDTLARALAGGNENASEDMGALVGAADKIRYHTGACVLFIHHSGKDAAKGGRGHSSLKAACDTEIEVSALDEGGAIARVTRQRDLDTRGEFSFKLQAVELGLNQRGKQVSSCIVVDHTARAVAKQNAPARVSANEQIGLQTLNKAVRQHGYYQVFPDHGEVQLVPEAIWREMFYQQKPGDTQGARQKAFVRVRDRLLASGRVQTVDDLVWLFNPARADASDAE